ncbi:MAG: dienelactone hydrolase family protein [Acidimicrobiia bacterium]|nr:dienelactone hydrolase family protein [Acidimicrobiia bacterium]
MAIHELMIPVSAGIHLAADVVMRQPGSDGEGTVVFAHGSGSSRLSPRNRHVASVMAAAGLNAVLLDLLTREEEAIDIRTREHRFDIGLLADRLIGSIDWIDARRATDTGTESAAGGPASTSPFGAIGDIGAFGASTGAAAALIAAAERPSLVKAVVSRGGRPDLAGDALTRVTAPTLFIVGERDRQVLALNEQARAAVAGPAKIDVVPGATHLFEEPGALDTVAHLATTWFQDHLAAPRVR